jgi:MFS transporter, ACS family, D-galactonate transporter
MSVGGGVVNASRGRRTNVRWLMVNLAFLATSINYIDRANLGVAVPFMEKELHIGEASMGLILGAFFWTYAVFQLPAGYYVDRLGARLMYSVAVV